MSHSCVYRCKGMRGLWSDGLWSDGLWNWPVSRAMPFFLPACDLNHLSPTACPLLHSYCPVPPLACNFRHHSTQPPKPRPMARDGYKRAY
ncbi:hypothetical protein RSOLAG1IB_09747 [Rhizoctonia solani AG-1 IB]|uniref:Uncharacterized protein n=1 Tax=Thanatephorus cucumeris (strain AG1-IB / isolate 7/3/14) TaxID=1108050 RepID=A0A0B7FSD7_THACB|nr:hypothetical protein RSOLAG1IB_09747 [Rhizoctonia solani AG-1 IB]